MAVRPVRRDDPPQGPPPRESAYRGRAHCARSHHRHHHHHLGLALVCSCRPPFSPSSGTRRAAVIRELASGGRAVANLASSWRGSPWSVVEITNAPSRARISGCPSQRTMELWRRIEDAFASVLQRHCAVDPFVPAAVRIWLLRGRALHILPPSLRTYCFR